MKGLEDDADAVAAKARELIFAELAEIGAVDDDAAGARPFEPADHHHHRRLAGAGRTDNAHRLARADGKRHAAQHVDGTGRARQC